MRHPAEGVLRRLLDEPSAVAVSDRDHVSDCDRCLSDLDTLHEDAALVGACLTTGAAEDVDVDAAWQRLCATAPATAPARAPRPRPRVRGASGLLRRPSVAALAVAVALGGAGTAAANDWLPIFKTEQVQPVSIGPDDLVALPDLSAYGELDLTAEPDVHEVPDAAAARAESGLDVPEVVELPQGVEGQPAYSVGSQATATFTFSAERAARTATEAGEQIPPVPAGLDGSTVRLQAGPGVSQVWMSSAGAPALLVGRAVAPSASSSGVPFEDVRDHLLSLPGLPDPLADQLRTFTADGTTLPLPVPADEVVTTKTTVDGAQATVVSTRDRTLAGVVWVDDGLVTVVAGSLDTDEVLEVARELE